MAKEKTYTDQGLRLVNRKDVERALGVFLRTEEFKTAVREIMAPTPIEDEDRSQLPHVKAALENLDRTMPPIVEVVPDEEPPHNPECDPLLSVHAIGCPAALKITLPAIGTPEYTPPIPEML